MNTIDQIKITKAEQQFRQSVVALLQAEKLPAEDLPASLDNFLVATDDDKVIGAIGLEQYDNCGLLRSMVVHKGYRNKNIATRLVNELESLAALSGIDCIYLLTETAPQYFERKGYEKISRDEVPKLVQASTEFSSVCPVSAIVMKKEIKNKMKRILILCTGNSCRSQMAEGYLRHFAGDKAEVYSAGIETHGVNRKAIQVMKEDGIDIAHHTSNNVNEYRDINFDFVITVCDNAKERCPVFPSNAKKFHYNFPDPAKATGTEEEIVQYFRETRNMIKKYSKDFIENNL